MRPRMATNPAQQQLQGFVVGALVVGAIAAGFFLSRAPSDPAPVPPAPLANAAFANAPAPSMPMPMPQRPVAPGPEGGATRQQADSLFNAVMTASETGDQATVTQMLPGALAAYRALGPLDDDGTFHVAILELSGGRYAEARTTAAALLAKNPKHLLALAVSMRAAVRGGDAAAAREFAKTLLEGYEQEVTRPLPEYQDHGRVLPSVRAEAEAAAR